MSIPYISTVRYSLVINCDQCLFIFVYLVSITIYANTNILILVLLLWSMLFADDIVLCKTSRENAENKFQQWKKEYEDQ